MSPAVAEPTRSLNWPRSATAILACRTKKERSGSLFEIAAPLNLFPSTTLFQFIKPLTGPFGPLVDRALHITYR